MKKRNFDITELKGNHVVYSGPNGCGEIRAEVGRVVGCEYGVGLSIVSLYDPESFLVCIPLKGIPGFDKIENYLKPYTNEVFDAAIDGIIAGHIYVDDLDSIFQYPGIDYFLGGSPDGGICPFGA